eukprot:365912-Chlamydomonas_euryale.AAC.3
MGHGEQLDSETCCSVSLDGFMSTPFLNPPARHDTTSLLPTSEEGKGLFSRITCPSPLDRNVADSTQLCSTSLVHNKSHPLLISQPSFQMAAAAEH